MLFVGAAYALYSATKIWLGWSREEHRFPARQIMRSESYSIPDPQTLTLLGLALTFLLGAYSGPT